MAIAIISRIENYDDEIPFNTKFYIEYSFKEISDKLNILLIPIMSDKNLEEILSICDGLIVTGSANNIYPKYYNEVPINSNMYKYDEFPFVKKVIKTFYKKNKPILGICGGLQEINVTFGGSLHQKIPFHNLRNQSQHKIILERQSLLYSIYRKDVIDVNSYHTQAIKDIADGFRITAISKKDNIIEAIERENIIAVQWHPEKINDITLFEYFMNLTKRKE